MSICKNTIRETALLLKNKKISVAELTCEYLKAIKKSNPSLNTYVTICDQEALKSAEASQRLIDSGENISPLCGIPMALKDNICTRGIRTTCASKMLESYVPSYSATVYERLEESGAVLLGKLNMDEFAMGSSSERTIFGAVRNPWNNEYVAGGSSGGSAASVAANSAAFSLGSDTGGSIRQPAAFCGVVGLKPTYGRVSRYGLVAFASSFDQIGPITKDVSDCALVMNTIAGYDPRDSTSIDIPRENYLEQVNTEVSGINIGIPTQLFGLVMADDVKTAVIKAIKSLESRGTHIMEVSLPSLLNAVPSYYLISAAEASSNLGRYDGIRYGYRNKKAESLKELYTLSRGEGFGNEVKRRILAGTYVLSSGFHDELYVKALKVRAKISNEFSQVFNDCQIVAAPVYPTTAFKVGEKIRNPLDMLKGDIFTAGANLAGLPALSIPCGLGENGMPIGIQLIGPPFSERLLLKAGYAIEQEMGRLQISRNEEAL